MPRCALSSFLRCFSSFGHNFSEGCVGPQSRECHFRVASVLHELFLAYCSKGGRVGLHFAERGVRCRTQMIIVSHFSCRLCGRFTSICHTISEGSHVNPHSPQRRARFGCLKTSQLYSCLPYFSSSWAQDSTSNGAVQPAPHSPGLRARRPQSPLPMEALVAGKHLLAPEPAKPCK